MDLGYLYGARASCGGNTSEPHRILSTAGRNTKPAEPDYMLTPHVYRPTVLSVEVMSDVYITMPPTASLQRNNVEPMHDSDSSIWILPLVHPGERIQIANETPVLAAVKVAPPEPHSIVAGAARIVKLVSDPDRGPHADLGFTLTEPTTVKLQWSPHHVADDHTGRHHASLTVYGKAGWEQASIMRRGLANLRTHSFKLTSGEYRIRIAAADDNMLRFCGTKMQFDYCKMTPDSERTYPVRVQWLIAEQDAATADPTVADPESTNDREIHATPSATLNRGEHRIAVTPRPNHAQVSVPVRRGRDLVVTTTASVPLHYETRGPGDAWARGICKNNRCVLPRMAVDQIFISAEHVSRPTLVPLKVVAIPPPTPVGVLEVGEVQTIDMDSGDDPRGPVAEVIIAVGIPGTYVVTGHVVTGDASPAPVFELFTPFGGDASESMGNVMVTRTVPRGRITTDPVYGAKLIEIAQAGRYIIRIDGNGSTPSRTVRLALETWK